MRKKIIIVIIIGLVVGIILGVTSAQAQTQDCQLWGGYWFCPGQKPVAADQGYKPLVSSGAHAQQSAPGPQIPDTAVAAGLGAGFLAAGAGLDPYSAVGIGFLAAVLGKEIQYQREKNRYENWSETIWHCDASGICRQETRGIQIRTGRKNVSVPKYTEQKQTSYECSSSDGACYQKKVEVTSSASQTGQKEVILKCIVGPDNNTICYPVQEVVQKTISPNK